MAYGTGREGVKSLVNRVAPSVASVVPLDADYEALPEASGFFVADGHLVTARSALHRAMHARVVLMDGAVHDVIGLLAEDAEADLALLAVDIPDGRVPRVRLAVGDPEAGEDVVAVGGRLSSGGDGVATRLGEVKDLPLLGAHCMLDDDLAETLSGCPLVGMDGEVLGMGIVLGSGEAAITLVAPAFAVEALAATGFQKLEDRDSSAEPDIDGVAVVARAALDRDWDRALAALDALEATGTAEARIASGRASILMRRGDPKDAARAAREAADLAPQDPKAWERLGDALAAGGDPQEAVEAFRRAVQLSPRDPSAHNRLGVSLYNRGRYTEAVDALKRSIELNSDGDREARAQEYKNLGVACFALGRDQEAVEAFRDAVRLKPDFDRAWKDLGMSYYRLGKYEKAAEATREAIRIRPDLARAHNNLGVAYQAMGRFDDATDAYRQALRLRPRFGQAWSNLAHALLRQGKKSEAVRTYKDALDQDPNNVEARASLGALYRKLGALDEAGKTLADAIKMQPEHAGAHYQLGLLHCERGDKGAALDTYMVLKEIDEATANRLFDAVYR